MIIMMIHDDVDNGDDDDDDDRSILGMRFAFIVPPLRFIYQPKTRE